MIAIVAGGSGLVGSELVRLLITHPKVTRVIAVGRTPPAVAPTPKLESITFEALSERTERFESGLAGAAAFCALGTTIRKAGSREEFRAVDFDLVVAFARDAHRLGVRRFSLVSATGADSKSFIFYNQVKGETEAAVQGIGFERLDIHRPALLVGAPGRERREFRRGEAAAVRAVSWIERFLPSAPWLDRLRTPADHLAQQMVTRLLDLG